MSWERCYGLLHPANSLSDTLFAPSVAKFLLDLLSPRNSPFPRPARGGAVSINFEAKNNTLRDKQSQTLTPLVSLIISSPTPSSFTLSCHTSYLSPHPRRIIYLRKQLEGPLPPFKYNTHRQDMILISLLTVVLASLARISNAQDQFGPIVYDAIHNATSIYGTWSSGSKGVTTGPTFANPANMSFNYPKTTGISYSFTNDGFYEIARYRFNSNGSEPTCITGVIGWVHGTYSLNANGSISMVPLGDGYQQVQDPCAAVSNFIETYNLTEYYKGWRIFQDPTQGYKLHMFSFDGSPLAPMFQLSTTPNMLPTQQLRNVSASSAPKRRSIDVSSNANEVLGPRWIVGVLGAAGLVLTAVSSLVL